MSYDRSRFIGQFWENIVAAQSRLNAVLGNYRHLSGEFKSERARPEWILSFQHRLLHASRIFTRHSLCLKDMKNPIDAVVEYIEGHPVLIASIVITGMFAAVAHLIVNSGYISNLRGGEFQLTETYAKYPLLARTQIAHNSWILKIGLKKDSTLLGLPLGQCISIRAFIEGEEVERRYTPITSVDTKGYFELLIKTYAEPHGIMTRHIEALPLGSMIEIRGPLGDFKYEKGMCRHLCLIAGGTGITPCYTVLTHILNDVKDFTKISLIFANISKRDILLYEQLNQLASAYPKQFDVLYVLNHPPAEGWSGAAGYVTKEIIKERFGPPKDDMMVNTCGPPLMRKSIAISLVELGFKQSQSFKF